MHLEFLVEDQSGKTFLDLILPKMLTEEHSFQVHSYRGIGRIPRNLVGNSDPQKRILLDRLPQLLRGYGKTFSNYPGDYRAAVIVVCDIDQRCVVELRNELNEILIACNPRPDTYFCFAVEEGEAWLLGDLAAVKAAYPKAKNAVLNSYDHDAICGTWERLADAIFPGGAQALIAQGWQATGIQKSKWVQSIAPHMQPADNLSPSFQYFRTKIERLTAAS